MNEHQSNIIVCCNVTNLSSQRASATGLVMAGFGLSAFFFTTLSNTLLRSTTSKFLLILALGTSCLMLLGVLFVRPVPLPEQRSSQLEDGVDVPEPALSPALQYHNHIRTPLLNDHDDSIKNRYVRTDIANNGGHSNSVGGVMEATRSVSQMLSTPLNIYGKALLSNWDFWLLFSICSMRMFLPIFFPFQYLLNYKNSSWDWLYLYVLNLSKIFTGIII